MPFSRGAPEDTDTGQGLVRVQAAIHAHGSSCTLTGVEVGTISRSGISGPKALVIVTDVAGLSFMKVVLIYSESFGRENLSLTPLKMALPDFSVFANLIEEKENLTGVLVSLVLRVHIISPVVEISFPQTVTFWGTWVAQSVEHLTLVQVMTSWFTSSSPT